jgi:orotidine-5'-phosphate decarboxylase
MPWSSSSRAFSRCSGISRWWSSRIAMVCAACKETARALGELLQVHVSPFPSARVSFYKIGLGMLTGGGLALANELKQDHGKRIFLDMKLFDIGATVEAAVRGWRSSISIS